MNIAENGSCNNLLMFNNNLLFGDFIQHHFSDTVRKQDNNPQIFHFIFSLNSFNPT